MHLINAGHSPQYLRELVSLTFDITFRSRIRSISSRRYATPATRVKIGERGFSFASLAAWHSLQHICDHQAFERNLKTQLFNRVYTT